MKSTNDKTYGLSSILSTLSKDHDDLRKLIEVLKSGSKDFSKKKSAYKQFSELLKSHAKSEEKAVYEIALLIKDLKMETFEAYEEHEVAASLMKKIDATSNKDQWMGRAKVLAEAVEHHIIEEENDYLLELKKKIDDEEELEMISLFFKKRLASKHQPSEENNGALKVAHQALA